MTAHSRVHFVSGLPRSGSTLLNALLSQNPGLRVSGRSSPIAPMILTLTSVMTESEYRHDFPPARRDRILTQIVDGYFGVSPTDSRRPVLIDTHRDWCARLNLIEALFPSARIVCCVRDPVWILDSLERLIIRDPLLSSRIVPVGHRATQHGRLEHLLSPDGVFGYAWRVLTEAFHGPFADRLILVDYEYLARYPGDVLRRLERLLDLPRHDYDTDNLTQMDAHAYDTALATPGLHVVRPQIRFEPRRTILPPATVDRLQGGMFWRTPDAVARGAEILA
ncbi:sulfotransferase family protein [Swaminathania salitolerans]|uniref:Sulfotransferase n=1 Tax=Swaminathania salitolerans TaxID=182838 RepID=A0A511BPV4_9PROT|nr:sulfotransferase [Swaminathania salitolerans]GBQ11146.1 sulfotransferase [Swaminathania salitolerans LMG 21291]GEL02361.1 hypothetical protein SSA02_15240 [Swaminathania salitolerans]